MGSYSVSGKRATLDREERVRATGMLKGKGAMASIDLREVREAIARAERRKRGTDGRVLLIGPHVAEMVTRLVVLEGSEEAGNGKIHKTNSDMRCKETSIETEKKLKTAKRVAKEEGLVDIWTGPRPGDGLLTTWYRLDLWQVARVVNRSEIENTQHLLEREGRRRERDRLNKKLRALRVAEKDLNLIGGPDSGPDPTFKPLPFSRVPPAKKAAIQESTQEVTSVGTNVPTPVRDEAPEAGLMRKIYRRMKDARYRLDNEEYAFNLARVRSLLSEDGPTDEELEKLPDGCVEYFEWVGKLDAGKALRRIRQQAARSEREALERPSGSPEHVLAALVESGGFVGSIAPKVCAKWDFRKDEDPPWRVLSDLGTSASERDKHLERMRRIAREAKRSPAPHGRGRLGVPGMTTHRQKEEGFE